MKHESKASLHVQLNREYHDRYSWLVFELRMSEERFRTDLTEITNALYWAGPRDVDALRQAVMAWRDAER